MLQVGDSHSCAFCTKWERNPEAGRPWASGESGEGRQRLLTTHPCLSLQRAIRAEHSWKLACRPGWEPATLTPAGDEAGTGRSEGSLCEEGLEFRASCKATSSRRQEPVTRAALGWLRPSRLTQMGALSMQLPPASRHSHTSQPATALALAMRGQEVNKSWRRRPTSAWPQVKSSNLPTASSNSLQTTRQVCRRSPETEALGQT